MSDCRSDLRVNLELTLLRWDQGEGQVTTRPLVMPLLENSCADQGTQCQGSLTDPLGIPGVNHMFIILDPGEASLETGKEVVL